MLPLENCQKPVYRLTAPTRQLQPEKKQGHNGLSHVKNVDKNAFRRMEIFLFMHRATIISAHDWLPGISLQAKRTHCERRKGHQMTRENLEKLRTRGPDDPPEHDATEAFPPLLKDEEEAILSSPALVVEALKQILESEYFRTSTRGKQFLRYVVRYRLEKHPEPLKERMIGAALFNRPLNYATGDDSVVRAQAREVRRRLEKYYAAHGHESPIRIDLPVGSYTPEFKLDIDRKQESGEAAGLTPLAIPPGANPASVANIEQISLPGQKSYRRFMLGVLATLACFGVLILILYLYRSPAKLPKSSIAQFWAPAFTTSKPLLICLPKPILYRPSVDLYKRSAKAPGEFDREVYRMNHRPHLQPNDAITWGDMVEYYDYGVSQGDVQATVRFSNFLGHLEKDSEVRIGSSYSYADLRNSPAVVIGAFSNPLTMEMTSGLHFSYVDNEKGLWIQEQGASGRAWFSKHGPIGEDYGLVTRLLDSNTGQFVVLVGGIEASGSDAAADLIVNPSGLDKALQNAPKDWPQKNVQIVVSTTVKDYTAGPAKVIAIYVW